MPVRHAPCCSAPALATGQWLVSGRRRRSRGDRSGYASPPPAPVRARAAPVGYGLFLITPQPPQGGSPADSDCRLHTPLAPRPLRPRLRPGPAPARHGARRLTVSWGGGAWRVACHTPCYPGPPSRDRQLGPGQGPRQAPRAVSDAGSAPRALEGRYAPRSVRSACAGSGRSASRRPRSAARGCSLVPPAPASRPPPTDLPP